MDKAQFEREMECGAALAIASRLLRRELITTVEHRTLTAALTRKIPPSQLTATFRRRSHPQRIIGRQKQKGGFSQPRRENNRHTVRTRF